MSGKQNKKKPLDINQLAASIVKDATLEDNPEKEKGKAVPKDTAQDAEEPQSPD